MAKKNEINDRIDAGYGLPKKNSSNNANGSSNAENNNCINYCCSGDFFIPLKEFEQIIYSGKIGTNAGKIKIKKPSFFPYAKFFWRNTIAIVDTRPKTVNYEKKGYLVKDQFEADINAYVDYQVTDAKMYYKSSQNVIEKLNQEIQKALREYFANKEFADLSTKKTSLMQDIGFELNKALCTIGVKIVDAGYTDCKLPQTLIDDAEKKKVQDLAHKRQVEEREFQQEQSTLKQQFQNDTMDPLIDIHEQNVAKRQAISDATKLTTLKAVIGDLQPEQQAEVIKAYLYANSNNNNGINIIDSNSSHKSK